MSIKVVFCDIGNTLIERRKWMPGAQDFINKVKTAGLKVGLLSNTGNMTRDQLANMLPEDFDFNDFEESMVMLSSETGIPKPSLGAFSLAVQHSGVSPWECLFIGESLSETMAAQSAGMLAARIVNAEKEYPALAKMLAK